MHKGLLFARYNYNLPCVYCHLLTLKKNQEHFQIGPDKEKKLIVIVKDFLTPQYKHVFWMLKRTVSLSLHNISIFWLRIRKLIFKHTHTYLDTCYQTVEQFGSRSEPTFWIENVCKKLSAYNTSFAYCCKERV